MIIKGHEVTARQQQAARDVMRGEFNAHDVRNALARAGVPTEGYVVERVADRIMQQERKAGRVEAVHGRTWRSI